MTTNLHNNEMDMSTSHMEEVNNDNDYATNKGAHNYNDHQQTKRNNKSKFDLYLPNI
jgi:hypothetical protein